MAGAPRQSHTHSVLFSVLPASTPIVFLCEPCHFFPFTYEKPEATHDATKHTASYRGQDQTLQLQSGPVILEARVSTRISCFCVSVCGHYRQRRDGAWHSHGSHFYPLWHFLLHITYTFVFSKKVRICNFFSKKIRIEKKKSLRFLRPLPWL